MKYLILILIITSNLIGCQKQKIAVDPVQIDVTHRIDLSEIEKYFVALCAADQQGFATVQECANFKIGGFVDFLGPTTTTTTFVCSNGISVNGAVVSTSEAYEVDAATVKEFFIFECGAEACAQEQMNDLLNFLSKNRSLSAAC